MLWPDDDLPVRLAENQRRPRSAPPWLAPLLWFLAGVVVAGYVQSATGAPLAPETANRLRAAWPDVQTAATLEAVPPILFAAVVVHESGVRWIRGGAGKHYLGPAQVHPRWVIPVLRRRYAPGIVAADLLDQAQPWGLLAGAALLGGWLRMGRGETWALCMYSGASLRADGGCWYADEVRRIETLVRFAVGGEA